MWVGSIVGICDFSKAPETGRFSIQWGRGWGLAQIYQVVVDALSLRPDILLLLTTFKKDFDVTWAKSMESHGSQYVAALLKPSKHITNGFGLENELLLIYHQYSTVQPRVLQIADKLLGELPSRGRAEPLAFVLVTAAHDAKAEVKRLLANSQNPRIIVPFTESECKESQDEYFVRNRLAEFFYSRDLFDMSRPLASDVYFFGRHALVLSIRDLLKSGENVGLFGLRRTGKTSVLLRLQRLFADGKDGRLIYFDLEDSALYQLRWWELLGRIATELPGSKNVKYTSGNAADEFRAALGRLSKSVKVVIALDEIEHITPGDRLRMREHWDKDFVELWKTVRAVQNANRQVSFIVCGTNAAPVETASFDGRDNPLFGMVTKRYMSPFTRDEVRQMTRTLGRFMGLAFEEPAFDYLHSRYGGHPFITRQACSRVFEELKEQKKPIAVSAKFLAETELGRDLHLFAHAENVLSVLQRWYPMEYEMLECLADNDLASYAELEAAAPELSAHLRGYGLVHPTRPELLMQFLASYIRGRRQIAKMAAAPNIDNADPVSDKVQNEGVFYRLAELGVHRNQIELKLRRFIKRVLIASKGASRWIDPVLLSIPSERREKLVGIDRNEILRDHLFLLDLLTVIVKNWPNFAHLEQQPGQTRVTKAQFEVMVDFLNRHREDAHAKDVDAATVTAVALAAKTLEAAIDPYLED